MTSHDVLRIFSLFLPVDSTPVSQQYRADSFCLSRGKFFVFLLTTVIGDPRVAAVTLATRLAGRSLSWANPAQGGV